jgi:hypothetical protein
MQTRRLFETRLGVGRSQDATDAMSPEERSLSSDNHSHKPLRDDPCILLSKTKQLTLRHRLARTLPANLFTLSYVW